MSNVFRTDTRGIHGCLFESDVLSFFWDRKFKSYFKKEKQDSNLLIITTQLHDWSHLYLRLLPRLREKINT